MELNYAGIYDGPTVLDELLTAFPAWIVGTGQDRQILVRVETTPTALKLTVPAGSDTATIDAIIAGLVGSTPQPGVADQEQTTFKSWLLATPRAQQLLTATWPQVEAAIDALDLSAHPQATQDDLRVLFKMSAGHVRIYVRREDLI